MTARSQPALALAAECGAAPYREVGVVRHVRGVHTRRVAGQLQPLAAVVDERLQHVATGVALELVALDDDERLVGKSGDELGDVVARDLCVATDARAAAKVQLPPNTASRSNTRRSSSNNSS